MDSIQTALLAIVQGVTELLPISSTGHVLLISKLFFNTDPTILLLTLLQFGTTISIVFAFKDYLLTDFFKKEKLFLYLKIVLATIPAVLIAMLFEKSIENALYNNQVIAISLFVWGVVMIFIENNKQNASEIKDIEKVSIFQALGIGLAQSLAIIPGTSRSGITTIAGVFLGLEKFTAIKFSFLLGLPILIGSFAYEMFKFRNQIGEVLSYTNIVGVVISFIVGVISISVLQRFSKKRFLTFFGVYRIILAIALFLFVI